MKLVKEKRAPRSRYSQAQIAEAKARLSLVELFERGGVTWDRKSRPAAGDYWACCPFHAEKSASLHVVERPAERYFKCHGCGAKGDVFDVGRQLLGLTLPQLMDGAGVNAEPDPELTAAREQARRELEAKREHDRAVRRAAAQRIYYAAGLLAGSPADLAYLKQARAIGARLANADLRFHPAAPLSPYEVEKAGRCPAMVAGVRNAAGELTGCHVTFLRADGSAKRCFEHLGGDARMIVGEHIGGFIRLGLIRGAAVIGEGIETTLSASEACGLPGLAAINAANLRAIVLPADVRRVVIAFDRDPKGVGEASAEALAERLWAEGREVEFLPPPDGAGDWNDAAKAGALPAWGACA